MTLYADTTASLWLWATYAGNEKAMVWDRRNSRGFAGICSGRRERILGFSSIGPFRAWAAYKYSVENSVYVAAEEREKALANYWYHHWSKLTQKLGLHTWSLQSIDATNEVSLRPHKSFGLWRGRTHFKEVGWKFNRWLDLKFLQLIVWSAINRSDERFLCEELNIKWPMTKTQSYATPNAHGYYGQFGGAYIPEMLHRNVGRAEDRNTWASSMMSLFKKNSEELARIDYAGRPTPRCTMQNDWAKNLEPPFI